MATANSKKKLKVAIKVTHPQSGSKDSILNEAAMLKRLNKHRIGPRLIKQGKIGESHYLVSELVQGSPIGKFIYSGSRKNIIKALKLVLEQCYELDRLGLNKDEMTNPYKHIIISCKGKYLRATMIDFERCKPSDSPSNVTQFCQYIMRNKANLESKGFSIDKDEIISKAKEYKKKSSNKEKKLALEDLLSFILS